MNSIAAAHVRHHDRGHHDEMLNMADHLTAKRKKTSGHIFVSVNSTYELYVDIIPTCQVRFGNIVSIGYCEYCLALIQNQQFSRDTVSLILVNLLCEKGCNTNPAPVLAMFMDLV